MRVLYYTKTPDQPFRYNPFDRETNQWFGSPEEAKALAEELARRLTPMQPVQCLVQVTWLKGHELHAVIAEHQHGHDWRATWYSESDPENFLNWQLELTPTDTPKDSVRCPRCLASFPFSQLL